MGKRLSKIVTRTGDDGSTGLAGGERVAKTHPRIEAIGDVDELNAQLGVLLALPLPAALQAPLAQLQQRLFDLGGELAMPSIALLGDTEVAALDAALTELNAALPPLREFVLPGGTPAAAACHVARAVARRVERRLWALHASEPLRQPLLLYANRLSDYLFVVARVLARGEGSSEPTWTGSR
jgi:cob(I)alamin adenosyltransferase